MSETIVNPEGTFKPNGVSSDGGWYVKFGVLLAALDILGASVGAFNHGVFAFCVGGIKKLPFLGRKVWEI